MGVHRADGTEVSLQMLQEAIDAVDVIGRWEYDVQNDRVYTDTLVALVFNVDPALAKSGTSIKDFLAGIHPADRERTESAIKRSAETGLCSTMEYRVCSADGVVRWLLDRGRVTLDADGNPRHGSGVVIDMTRTRLAGDGAERDERLRDGGSEDGLLRDGDDPDRTPLESAAEHCLAARNALHAVPEPLLHRMSDMLLLEVGRALGKHVTERRRRGVN